MGNYIVTGGAGFIGTHLTDLLIEAGHEVIIIDDFSVGKHKHPLAHLVKADIRDEKTIRPYFKTADACFHLVAVPSVIMGLSDWFHFHSINMQGSLIVLKLAVEAGNVPVIYASSCAVYGDAKELPLKENQFIQPISSYGCDKLSTEFNAFVLSKNYQLPTMGLRFFNVYGPGQNPNSPYSGVVTRFISNLKENKAPLIFGDGKQTRDFIFVKDVAQAMMDAIDFVNSDGHVVNICTGKGISINQLAIEIAKLMQQDIPPEYGPKRVYDVIDSVGCVLKMNSFGFKAGYDLSSGLKETIDSMS